VNALIKNAQAISSQQSHSEMLSESQPARKMVMRKENRPIKMIVDASEASENFEM
jgi:hypothetical protein